MTKDEGGPVYPGPKVIYRQLKDSLMEDTKGHHEGITRRDWLAGLAMQGLIVNTVKGYGAKVLARDAYKAADAMIAEGRKE